MWQKISAKSRVGIQSSDVLKKISQVMRNNFNNREYIDFVNYSVNPKHFTGIDLDNLDPSILENLIQQFRNQKNSVENIFSKPEFKNIFFNGNSFNYNAYGKIPEHLQKYYDHSNMQLARLAIIKHYLQKQLGTSEIAFRPLYEFSPTSAKFSFPKPGTHLGHYGFTVKTNTGYYRPIESLENASVQGLGALNSDIELHHLTPLVKQISDAFLNEANGRELRQLLLHQDPKIAQEVLAAHKRLNSGPEYYNKFLFLDQPMHTGAKFGIHNQPMTLGTADLQRLNSSLLQDYYRTGMSNELAADILLSSQAQLNNGIVRDIPRIKQRLLYLNQIKKELEQGFQGDIFLQAELGDEARKSLNEILKTGVYINSNSRENVFEHLGAEFAQKLQKYLRTRKYLMQNEKKLLDAQKLAADNGLDVKYLLDW